MQEETIRNWHQQSLIWSKIFVKNSSMIFRTFQATLFTTNVHFIETTILFLPRFMWPKVSNSIFLRRLTSLNPTGLLPFFLLHCSPTWLRIIWFRSVGVEPSTMGIHFALNVLLATGKYKLIATFPSWYYHFKVIIFDRLPEIPTRRQTHPGIAFWCYLFRPWVAETLFLLFQPEGFLFCNVRSLPKQWMT